MDNVFEQAKDVHVRATLVYVKTNDAYAYDDPDKTVKVVAADLKERFEKGLIVVDGTTEYKPVSLAISEGVATITYVKTDGATPTTAVLATLASKEYVAG